MTTSNLMSKAITLKTTTNDKGRTVLVSRKWEHDTKTGRDGKKMKMTSYTMADGNEIESGRVLTLKQLTGYHPKTGVPEFSSTRFDKDTLTDDELAEYKELDATSKAQVCMNKVALACKALRNIDSKSLPDEKVNALNNWTATQVSEALDSLMGKAKSAVNYAF